MKNATIPAGRGGGKTQQTEPVLKVTPLTEFHYLTDSLVMRKAERHPTKGWRTTRVKNLEPSLRGKDFDFNQLRADLSVKFRNHIYDEHANPMTGTV